MAICLSGTWIDVRRGLTRRPGRRGRRGLIAAAIVLLAAIMGTVGPDGGSKTLASETAAGALPQGQLALGVSASPVDLATNGWIAGSGVPWTYTYQYLSGGVNTGSGWQTWNSQGTFPILYAQAAQVRHAVPVFTYYMLKQSNGPCSGCSEAKTDLSDLNDPSTMASWYGDFATLMQRLGAGTHGGVAGYGGPAIVHVEPDLSGHAEQAVLDPTDDCFGFCQGTGNDPSKLRAAVASSGVADVSAFPNTYQGFNDAILHLRDLYAPNVALAFHVSGWSTLADVGSYSGTDINFATRGATAGSFAGASGVITSAPGVSTYDVVFTDVADNDAAKTGIWWDRTNQTVPNFTRWESYIAAAHQVTGKGTMVWQVPIGNQWFDTENNTNGHYQDNRVEYFLSHPAELVASGVVGILFGAGNPGSTVPNDGQNDGVTNPPSFCTSAGDDGGSVCNNHVSSFSDDDGGYLRLTAAAYYQNPTSLNPTPTGLLRAVSSPPLPTQVIVDGHIADSWGLAWLTLTTGSHTVAFTHVEGYTEPAPQTVNITAGATTTVTGTFTARGSLRVRTSPAVPSTITIDGNPADNWGVWTDLPPGSRQVCFGAVAGFTAPPCQTVTVAAGTETDVTGTFVPNPGAGPTGLGLLRVTTSPALPSQISITRQGGSPTVADSWGLNWLQLAPGTYSITFSHVEGYSEPAPQTVTITAGATTNATATFTARGSLRVTTSPAVPSTITIDGNPADNWGVWTDLPPGSPQVCFGAVAGFTAPPCQTVTVAAGTETDVTGTFTPA